MLQSRMWSGLERRESTVDVPTLLPVLFQPEVISLRGIGAIWTDMRYRGSLRTRRGRTYRLHEPRNFTSGFADILPAAFNASTLLRLRRYERK